MVAHNRTHNNNSSYQHSEICSLCFGRALGGKRILDYFQHGNGLLGMQARRENNHNV